MKARVAIEASNKCPVAVDLRERFLPRLPMQIIDILRDHETQNSQPLQFGQRDMSCVRLRNRERLEQLVVAFAKPLFPRLLRIGHEALKAIHRRLAPLCPPPARSSKRRDSAFDRHPSTG